MHPFDQTFINELFEPVLIFDQTGHLVASNKAFSKFVNLDASLCLGKSIEQIFDKGLGQLLHNKFEESCTKNKIVVFRFDDLQARISCQFKWIPQEKDYVLLVKSKWSLEANNLPRILNKQPYLDTSFDVSPVTFVLLDKEYNVTAYNNFHFLGYDVKFYQQVEMGKNIFEIIPPQNLQQAKENFDRAFFQNKRVTYQRVFEIDDEAREFTINVSPVRNQKETIGLIVEIFEVTNLHRLESEKQEIINDLLKKNGALQQFTQIISHNLRAPLTSIMSLATLVKDHNYDPEEELYVLNSLFKSAEQLDAVVQDLNKILLVKRDLSELRQPIEFDSLLKDVLSGLTFMLQEIKPEIISDFSLATSIISVKSYLNSIFYVLIVNAIKYARPNIVPIINIWSEEEDGRVVLYFKDNGLGIDLEKHGNKIFKLYQKFHPQSEGRGVGLFMVKTQVEELNGKIFVTSQPNVGTTFKIVLPQV